MTGKKIISEHHLVSVATEIPQLVLLDVNTDMSFGYIMKFHPNGGKESSVILFNRHLNDGIDGCHYIRREYGDEPLKLMPDAFLARTITFGTHGKYSFANVHIREIILLPQDFIENFRNFQTENKKFLGSKIFETRTENMNPNIAYIYAMSNGSRNLYAWGVSMYMSSIRTSIIKEVLMWANKYSNLSKGLKKGTITAYTRNDQILGLLSELRNLRVTKQISNVMNAFNTSQKKSLKSIDIDKLSPKDQMAFCKFAQLSLSKRQNFIKKMSSVEDPYEIIRQMRFLSNIHFEWNIDSFNQFLQNSNNLSFKVISNNGGIVLLSVGNFDTIKEIAKTTNWCISKNKSYWNNYVETHPGATQYVILDFTKKEDDLLSIIGFTSIEAQGITNAHDFKNNNMMNEEQTSVLSTPLEKFLPSNIFSILIKDGISLENVIKLPSIGIEWSRAGLLDEIHKIVPSYGIKTLKDNNNQLCLEIRDSSIKYAFPNAWVNEDEYDSMGNAFKSIIFADFNRPFLDKEGFVVAIIARNQYGEESPFCTRHMIMSRLTAPSFDDMLNKFSLPFDTIRRIDDIKKRFSNDFYNYRLNKDAYGDNLKKLMMSLKDDDEEAVNNTIIASISQHHSLDYVNTIYDCGQSLIEYCGNEIIKQVLYLLRVHIRNYQMNNRRSDFNGLMDIKKRYLCGDQNLTYSNASIGFIIDSVDKILSHEFSHDTNWVLPIIKMAMSEHNTFVVGIVLQIAIKYISVVDSKTVEYIRKAIESIDNKAILKHLELAKSK